MKNRVGIVGSLGTVGSALKRYFQKQDIELFLYDISGEGSIEEVNKADFIYICVPTSTNEKGECDISIIEEVVSQIEGSKVIIIKSTVIPGTTDGFQQKYPQHKFLFNPEFLTELTADQDMNYPDRQIIGYTKESYTIAGEVMKQLPLAPYEAIMPAFMAEFAKYVANTWFAVKVAKNNEVYDVFKEYGGTDEQFDKMIEAVSADKRIGRTHLVIWHKGKRGYNGRCLPKDAKAFLRFAESIGTEMPILKTADEYNDRLLKDVNCKRLT